MRLISIHLKNYRQYSSFSREFCGNLIGVIGHNGVGKSHLLEAVHFALAGEVPGSIKSKLLRWSTGVGFVQLVFVAGGEVYKVTRNLHDSIAILQTESGKPDVCGISNVTAKIMEILDIDKDILRQSAFVRQAEIDTILFTEPKTRELAFQKLCGVANAHKVHAKLGNYIAQIPLQYNYEEQKSEALMKQKELDDRRNELDKKIEELSSFIKTILLNQTKEQATKNRDTMISTLADFDSEDLLQNEHDSLLFKIDELEKEIKDINNKIKDIDIDKLDSEISRLKVTMANVSRYMETYELLKTVNKELSNLVEPTPQTEINIRKAQERCLREKFMAVKSEYKAQYNMYEALDFNTRADQLLCPMCESQLDPTKHAKLKLEIAEKVSKLQTELSRLEPTISALCIEIDTMEQQLQAYLRSSISYKTRKESLENQLKSFDPGIEVISQATIAKELAGLLEFKTATSGAITNKVKVEGRLTELRSRKVNVGDSLSLLRKRLDGANRPNIQNKLDSLKERLKKYDDIEGNIRELSGTRAELMSNLTNLTKSIEQLDIRIASAESHRQALVVLSNVREWFHYSNGPHHIASLYLNQLTKDTNKFLDKFSAKFIATPDSTNLGFNVIYTDGRPMPLAGYAPAEDLSGGEKVLLAISFRFSNYCLFASKLGLLSLDEPTVFLDKDNVVNFCSLMETIKTIISNMGIQILISTHEEGVIPYLDDVIDLNKLGESK